MINLLPEKEKKKLRNESRLRLGVVILCVTFFLEVLTAILFIPSFYILSSSTNVLRGELEQSKKLSSPSDGNVQRELSRIKEEITLLSPPQESPDLKPSELLAEILSLKPQGIAIESFSFAVTNNMPTIQFSGMADTREDLLVFQRNIKQREKFHEVKYDQSFITKKTMIDFRLTIGLKPPEKP